MDSAILSEKLVSENYTAIYARHSNIDEKNNSNLFQINQCKEIASKLNLIVYKSYEDEGSGFSVPPESRNGFKQLLIDAEAGYFKNLIVWKIDRLWRQSYDYPKTKKLLESYGVKLIFSDMLEIQNMNPIYKNFMTNMFLSIAELEPNKIREKTVDGRNFKRSLGIVFLKYYNFGYIANKDKIFINSQIAIPEIAKATETYYVKNPLQAAFINSCFKIYKNSSGNHYNKIKQIKLEMNFIDSLFKDITLENFKAIVENIPNKSEITPIKDELRAINESLSQYSSEKICETITLCCKHISTTSNLEQMLINHHYCGINVIEVKDNHNLLIFDEKSSAYILNDAVFNKAVNIDIIVDKDLWFEVATNVLNFRRLKPGKVKSGFNSTIKCGSCRSMLELKDNLYKCPKCGIEIYLQEIKDKIIQQLINDNFFGKVMEQINFHNDSLNKRILNLEREIKKHESKIASYALKYISISSSDLVELINTESEKSRRLKDNIGKLQREKESYVKFITNQLFKTEDGSDNLKEKLNRFFIDEKSKADDFLNNIIKEAITLNGKVKNKYIKIG